jgi:DNA polymerase
MNVKQSKALLLQKLYEPYKKCSPCPLGLQTKHNFVCGHGSPDATLMLIGEAPGQHEDEQGLPFVGKSGMLLTKTLACLGIDRKDIFITNIVKCRPTNNRKPTPDESKAYKNLFLLKEIEIIKPTVICTLGATSLEGLIEAPVKMGEMHGKPLTFGNTILIPTYHPAYILRDPRKFNEWLADLQKAWTLAHD